MIPVGIACSLIAVGTAWAVTPFVIRLAHLLGAVDRPGARKIHQEPIPRIGGLAVFAGFVAGLAFAAYVTGVSLVSVGQFSVYWRGFVVAAVFVLLLGLVDDLRGLSFRWKFAGQVVAAMFVWFCGFRIETMTSPLGGSLDLGAFSLPFTVLWVVAITNAVNLIDGLDGLATGICLITTSTVGVIALLRNELGTAAASITLAGSLLGFLRYNFSPARIFLGDSGSLFLGFVLAVTAVRGSQKGPTAVALLVPLLVLGLPLMDTSLAVARRLHRLTRSGIRSPSTARYMIRNFDMIFLPDREHLHHRLLELGLSHRRAVFVLYSIAVACALGAFAVVLLKSISTALVLVGLLFVSLAAFVVGLYLRVWRLRRVEASRTAPFSSRPQAQNR